MSKTKVEITSSTSITAIKAFNPDMTCRGMKFELGKTFTVNGKIKACENGLHSCPYFPLDVWEYYSPSTENGLTRYFEVDAFGRVDRDGNKIASSSLTLKAEIKLPDLIGRAVKAIMARIDPQKPAATNTGDRSAATNTGYQSAATNTGYQSAATNTGDRSAATNTGDQSAATNTGDRSAATNTGYQSAATNTGDRSAATNTGYQSAATNTGFRSAATNTGDQSAATNTGDRSAASVEGKSSIAIASGRGGKAMANHGSALVLCEYDKNGTMTACISAIAGVTENVKADTWYTCVEGKFVELNQAKAEALA